MEYLYTFYILSGVIKGFLNFFDILLYIDFTLLTGSLLFAGLFFHVMKKRVFKFDAKAIVSICLLLFFYLWINVTILYSPSLNYSYQKAFLFLTNLLAFMIPLFYDKFDIRKFIKFFTILSPILGVLFLVFFAQVFYLYDDAAKAFKSLYLVIPLFCGLCVLVLVIIGNLFTPLLNGLFIIINTLILILTGGRGPILFTAAVLMLYLSAHFFSGLIGSQKNKHNILSKSLDVKKILLLTFIGCISLFLLASFIPDTEILFDRTYARMMTLFEAATTEMIEQSTMARIDHFAFSFNLIFDNVKQLILGYGLGSYGILYSGIDERFYPHNIILEIWFETGLVGLLAIFPFFFFVIYTCRKHISANPFAWIVLFIFLNSMKSGSLVDMRVLFSFLAMMALHSKLMKKGLADVSKGQCHHHRSQSIRYSHLSQGVQNSCRDRL